MFSHRLKLTDTHLLILGLIGIVVAALLTAGAGTGSSAQSLSVRSRHADGAMALRLWLEKLGYEARELVSPDIAPDVEAIFLLNPSLEYTEAEADALYDWVVDGHTLIVASNTPYADSVLQPYDVSLSYLESNGGTLAPTSPTLTTLPFSRVRVGQLFAIESDRSDLVIHLAQGDQPVLASLRVGAGEIWIAGTVWPFTNQGLRDESSARLIANLVATIPPGATVAFDEAHHGIDAPPSSLSQWFFSTTAGWSILIATGMVLGYALLRGRRFGQPVPLYAEQLRREPTEYIHAVANLFRLSRQRDVALKHYRNELKRSLATRYTLDPGLADSDFVRVLALREPALDTESLADLLARLASRQVSEQELVALAMKTDEWIGDLR